MLHFRQRNADFVWEPVMWLLNLVELRRRSLAA